MKGVVFGGVLHMPDHPAADIHGLVRACIRTKSWLWAEEQLQKAGIPRTHALWSTGIWSESHSAVEILTSQQHYGELLVCPLVESYINAEAYQAYRKTSKNTPAAPTPTVQLSK